MSNYKIVVVDSGDGYRADLFKKGFLIYYPTGISCVGSFPYDKGVIQLQKQYNVPDRRVIFRLKNQTNEL